MKKQPVGGGCGLQLMRLVLVDAFLASNDRMTRGVEAQKNSLNLG